jgi:serine/threonine-protein kinase
MTLSYLGEFEVLGELYRDPSGVIYKARHTAIDRLVALKVPHGGSSPTPADRQRFLREAEAMARCQHPHVLQVYQVGEANGVLYMALQLVEGGSLADRLTTGRLPVAAAARLIALVADAAEHLHRGGLIHRDITPANILLGDSRDAPIEQCHPHLAGFWLCRHFDREPPLPGSVSGPALLPAHDIWGLGVTLYQCLTGRLPFKGATDEETLQLVMNAPPPPMRSLVPDLPAALEAICLRCLEKGPQRRYSTAAELAAALEQWRA